MSNIPDKVIWRRRMRLNYLCATLTCQGANQYTTTITRELEGLSTVVATRDLIATSNRQAIRKAESWLDVEYPLPAPTKSKLGDPFQ
jgi:hypothetical protein